MTAAIDEMCARRSVSLLAQMPARFFGLVLSADTDMCGAVSWPGKALLFVQIEIRRVTASPSVHLDGLNRAIKW